MRQARCRPAHLPTPLKNTVATAPGIQHRRNTRTRSRSACRTTTASLKCTGPERPTERISVWRPHRLAPGPHDSGRARRPSRLRRAVQAQAQPAAVPQGGCDCRAAAAAQQRAPSSPPHHPIAYFLVHSRLRAGGATALITTGRESGNKLHWHELLQARMQHIHKHCLKAHGAALSQERLATKHKTLRSSFASRCSSSRTDPSDTSGQPWERAWSPHTAACRSCKCAQSPARAGHRGWGPSAGSRWTAAPALHPTAAGAAAPAWGRTAVRRCTAPGCRSRL